MDGPMRPYLPELTIRDYNIYQWYLRGVQYQLNTTYGLYSCSLLQHNGVLFALLSDSLAGREATCKKVRLPWTLCWRPMMCQTQGIRLAAQVEVLLGWHKLQDRRCDELPFQQRVKRTIDRILLRRAYEKAVQENPALERLFEQEQEQAIVQMNLNAKNYTEVAEPMAVWPVTSGPGGTMCIWSMVSRTPVLHWKMPGGSRWLRQTIWCAPTGCWMSS